MDSIVQIDYILVHQIGLNLQKFLLQKLIEAFRDAYIELPEKDALPSVPDNVLKIRFTKALPDKKLAFSGITLNLDEFDNGEDSVSALVTYFNNYISGASDEGIEHVIKLYDHFLYHENVKYVQEIFEIEMKLREVFSVIFIDSVQAEFYNLIRDVNVKPMNPPQEQQMYSRMENEFFYLTFSQYRNLNDKKPIGNMEQMISLLRKMESFNTFQEYFTQPPIRDEKYSDFITSLKMLLEPIEELRNCIAHNRTISEKVKGDYSVAKQRLVSLIDSFFQVLQDVG